MIVVGVDPGPETSGIAYYDSVGSKMVSASVMNTEQMVRSLHPSMFGERERDWLLAVEYPQVFGGSGTYQSVLDTAYWVGRLVEAWGGHHYCLVRRNEVLKNLKIKVPPRKRDAAVRARMIQLLGKPGTQRSHGPTFGCTYHAWQALAVAYVVALGT